MTKPHFPRIPVILILLSASLFGCHVSPKPSSVPAPPAKVLIIGDSISIGYFEPTKSLLCGKADVTHNAGCVLQLSRG